MFSRHVLKTSALILFVLAGTAPAQPLEWSDDFLTAATYDSTSLLAPCYSGPPTKYTILDAVDGDIFNERSISGNGKIFITNREASNGGNFTLLSRPLELTIIGWLGSNLFCPGEPPFSQSSHPFTSRNLCVYGGFQFNHWQTKRFDDPGMINNLFGDDQLPGIAGVDDDHDGTTDGTIGFVGTDDDGDGTTDELNEVPDKEESHARRPTDINDGYGNGPGSGPMFPTGTGFLAGFDDAPGAAGVDDDGNGTTDELGEMGWPGTDDGDDTPGLMEWTVWTRIDFIGASAIGLTLVPGTSESRTLFRMVENPPGTFLLQRHISVDEEQPGSDELVIGFYQPNTQYNYVFCTSGTCYGAMLWVETNMSNPAETLGPLVSTFHTVTGPSANAVALANGVSRGNQSEFIGNAFTRHATWRVNSNFSHKFWVVSGNPMLADFTNGIFGYPSPSSDLDNDRDVDAEDFLTFSNCFNGALNPPKSICANLDADLDEDGDVDPSDFLTFSNCFAGSLTRPPAFCFPPDLTACGGQSAMGGGGSLLAQSAIAFDPFLFDGMTPTEEFWYFYTPTCTGNAALALCDGTGQGRSVDGIRFGFFDGTGEEATVVPAASCGQSATETVPVVAGQTVSLLVYRDARAESLDGFTLNVSCSE